ncbi:MAG: hypothetical protein GOU97_02860 [Nanoarchaeota archaeon]|nr:hypothetical protein [Nanoarchaeota archaeon]
MRKQLTLITFLLVFTPVLADNMVSIEFYHLLGCHGCAYVQTSQILNNIPNLTELEISRNQTNTLKYLNVLDEFGINDGVPLIIITCNGERGYLQGPGIIINNLSEQVEKCIQSGMIQSRGEGGTTSSQKELTFFVIITAAIIDSINPCAFAVMIFLLSTIISLGSRRKIIKIGSVYIITVFITYLLAGIGIFTVIQKITSLTFIIYNVAAWIAIIFGIINVKDFFFYGKGISLKIPESRKGIISKFSRKATVPAAIVLGFLVAMFELPCTGGVYLAILSLLARSGFMAIPYLMLYNIIFVLPLFIIMALAYVGVSTKKLEKWRMGKRNWMKLLLGAFMIILGIGMLLGWF